MCETDRNLTKLLDSLTDQHKTVIQAFQMPCKLSLDDIMERTGLSASEADAALQELIELGLVGTGLD